MAKNEKTPPAETTSLVTTTKLTGNAVGEVIGHDPEDFFALGFSEQRIVKIGDPQNGGIGAYIGEILGPGPDIEVATPGGVEGEVGVMHTWLLRPLNVSTLQPNQQASDQVITPYSLNQAFERIFKYAQDQKKRAISGAVWQGKTPIQGGRRMVNKYRVFERYVDPGEALQPAATT